jgi:hypothetical protein
MFSNIKSSIKPTYMYCMHDVPSTIVWISVRDRVGVCYIKSHKIITFRADKVKTCEKLVLARKLFCAIIVL